MSRYHVVEMYELEDFTFERIICASFPKQLTVYVDPADHHMHYKLYCKHVEIGIYNSLDVALMNYNEL